MKRNVLKIWGIVLFLIVICNNVCYADVIAMSPAEEFYLYDGWKALLGFVVFIIAIISFILLISTRKKGKKEILKLICKIFIALICSIFIVILITLHINKSYENTESYNKQFIQYKKSIGASINKIDYVEDVEGLINTAINNNKDNKKITLVYKENNYTSIKELEQLLKEININAIYKMTIKYDDSQSYIESIILNPFTDYNEKLYERVQYYEGNVSGSQVKMLLIIVKNCLDSEDIFPYYKNLKISFISDTNQTTIVNRNNIEEISNLEKQITNSKKYNVKFETEDIFNIIITSIN